MSDSVSLAKGSTGGDEDFSGTEVIIVEGFAKFRDVKRWKQRYCVLTKLSPAAGEMREPSPHIGFRLVESCSLKDSPNYLMTLRKQ